MNNIMFMVPMIVRNGKMKKRRKHAGDDHHFGTSIDYPFRSIVYITYRENNITLLEIPYWWDTTKNSVLATLHRYRPDIVPEVPKDAKEIPMSITTSLRGGINRIVTNADLMTSPM